MSYVPPSLALPLPGDSQGDPSGPLVANLPRAQASFQDRYLGQLVPALQSLNVSQPTIDAITRFNQERVQRGIAPLSERQTAAVAQTLDTKTAATPKHEPRGIPGFFQHLTDDVRSFAATIPRIPFALYNEAKELPTLPQKMQEMDTSGNPLHTLAEMASLPGIRMFPGSFLAGNLEHPGELLKHPLFTALDILPVASKFAGGTEVVKAAKAGHAAELERVGQLLQSDPEAAIGAVIPRAPKPISTYLTRTVDAQGNVVRNSFGEHFNDLNEYFKHTPPGRVIAKGFNRVSREVNVMRSTAERLLRDRMAGQNISEPVLQDAVDSVMAIQRDFPDDVISPDRRAQLTTLVQENSADIMGLPDVELSFVERLREIEHTTGRLSDARGTAEALIGDTPERYDARTASRLNLAQTVVNNATEVNQTFRHLDPSRSLPTDPAEFAALKDSLLESADLHLPTRVGNHIAFPQPNSELVLQSAIHGLGRMGYDTLPVLSGRVSYSQFLDDVRSGLAARRVPDVPTILQTLTRAIPSMSGSEAGVASKLRTLIQTGHFTESGELLRRSQTLQRFLGTDANELTRELRITRERNNFYRKYAAKFSDEKLASQVRRLDRFQREHIPARFVPTVQRMVREQIADYTRTIHATDPNLPQYLQLVSEDLWGKVPDLDPKVIRGYQRDISRTWLEIRASLPPELQPIFVHHVSPRNLSNLNHPRIFGPNLPTVTQTMRRTLDVTPHIPDAYVAMNHALMEHLQRDMSKLLVKSVVENYGLDGAEVVEQFRPTALRRADERAAQTGLPAEQFVLDETDRMIRKRYGKLADKGEEFFRGNPHLSSFLSSERWLPREVLANIDAWMKPEISSQVLDPTFQLFRTSVLALSPRWHVYNVLGNAITTAVTDPRAFMSIFRNMKTLRTIMSEGGTESLVRSGEMPAHIFSGGFQSAPEYVANWMKTASTGDIAIAQYQILGSSFVRKLWDSTQVVRDKFGEVVQKSYDFQSRTDDAYRAMAYLSEHDRTIKAGLSEAEAQVRGIALSRKLFQNWDEITPLERTVLRYWVPFYGFQAHVLRFVLNYPFDHPVRTSIISNIAKNELNDLGTTLPQRFLDTFFLGNPDKTGHVRAINLGGLNPFSIVPDVFSMLGFLGGSKEGSMGALTANANPIVGQVLQMLGVDTSTGGAALFPEMVYDPETGRLKAVNPQGGVGNFVSGFIPQTRLLTALAGWNHEFRDMLQQNPDAAIRYLMSSVGVPVLLRNLNVPEEQIKSELARLDAQDNARRAAMRSGDFGALSEYPGLSDFTDKIQKLIDTNPAALAPYIPERSRQDYLDLLNTAVTGSTPESER